MQLVLNGKPYAFGGATIVDLLEELGLQGRLAVEVNQDIIPKGEHSGHALNDGDVVEIVHAIGGG